MEACFTKHGSDAPGNPQLSIHFWVDEAGRVTNAEVDPASLRDTNLGKCLLALAQTTSFGPLQQAVSFHIPITAQAVEEGGPKK